MSADMRPKQPTEYWGGAEEVQLARTRANTQDLVHCTPLTAPVRLTASAAHRGLSCIQVIAIPRAIAHKIIKIIETVSKPKRDTTRHNTGTAAK